MMFMPILGGLKAIAPEGEAKSDLCDRERENVPSSRTSIIAMEGLKFEDLASMREDRVDAVMRGRLAIVVVMTDIVL